MNSAGEGWEWEEKAPGNVDEKPIYKKCERRAKKAPNKCNFDYNYCQSMFYFVA